MELIATLLGGGALGAVGSFLSNTIAAVIDLRKRAQQNEHELRLHELNLQAKADEREHEAMIAEFAGRSGMLEASYKHDAGGGPTYVWVASLLRLVRPALTFGLLGLCGWFFAEGAINQEGIVQSIVGYTGMAIAWWFADRRMGRGAA